MYKWAYLSKTDKTRILATPGVEGVCPLCDEWLRAKCGEVIPPYWSHKNDTICDHWWENKSPWHCWWQDRFPVACQEVVLDHHSADVVTNTSIIKFQKSHLSIDVIRERTHFYLQRKTFMRWVLKADEFIDNLEFSNISNHDDGSSASMIWHNPRAGWNDVPAIGGKVMFDLPFGFFLGLNYSVFHNKWEGWWGERESFVQKEMR